MARVSRCKCTVAVSLRWDLLHVWLTRSQFPRGLSGSSPGVAPGYGSCGHGHRAPVPFSGTRLCQSDILPPHPGVYQKFSHGNKFCSSPPRWQKRYYESTTEYSQEPRCACSLLELYCSVKNREKATKKEAEEKRRKREKEKSWSQTPSDERGEDCQSQSKSYQLELP